ncbi:MAG TPA: glycosyltransferase, partial [Bacteroidales bacterium]|nr:glycosyltransferase [Bacteroidales bacterium]
MKTISVVIPAFNEEGCIAAIVEKLKEVIDPLKYSYEVIIVDDGSKDNTFEVIKEQAKVHKFLKGIRLSRNMGHQAA